MENMENFDLIYSYTRAQALEDGVLIDVSKVAKEVGFKFPVAVTSSVWEQIKDIPECYKYQTDDGRLFDVLYMAMIKARFSKGSTMLFKLILPHYEYRNIVGEKKKDEQRRVLVKYSTFKAIIGPGDTVEPVVTIMMPNED